MTFVPSPRQQAIFDKVDQWSNTGNRTAMLVNAVAGSGKTTTILKAMARIPEGKKKLFLAFNVSAANEAKERAASMGIKNIDICTLNSAGFKILRSNRKTFIDDNKYSNILAKFAEDDKNKEKPVNYVRGPVLKMISLARAHGIIVKGNGLTPDTSETWFGIARKFNVYEFGGSEMFMARRALAFGTKSKIADFDDQCYQPFANGLASKEVYDAVVIDEAQDLTLVQQKLAGILAGENSLMMFVGDRNQAIYGFRGADVMSMDRILEMYGCEEYPLDVSYRCPKEVVKAAQQYSPAIQPHEDAIDGEVQDMESYYAEHFSEGDLVVCRNNAPLIKLAFKLIGDHKPISMNTDIVNRVITAFKFAKRLLGEKTFEEIVKDPDNKIFADQDLVECCTAVLGMSNDVDNAIVRLNSMLKVVKSGDATRLLTVHRAKGLESDIVWFLEPSLLPSQWAMTEEAMVQEKNLAYVAITRAKKQLNKISVDGYKGSRHREFLNSESED